MSLFKPASPENRGRSLPTLSSLPFQGLSETTLVFVNGYYRPELSATGRSNEAKVGNLADPLRTENEVESYLARFAGYQDHAFVALNTAFMEDGAWL